MSALRRCSAFPAPPVEHRFDVDDRGAVERFEFADQDPQALDGENLGPVQADWVGPVGWAGAEQAQRRAGGGIAWVGGEFVVCGVRGAGACAL
jgi:hypothetical protein